MVPYMVQYILAYMSPKMVPEIIILPEEFILADLRQYFLGGGQVKYRLNLRDGYDTHMTPSSVPKLKQGTRKSIIMIFRTCMFVRLYVCNSLVKSGVSECQEVLKELPGRLTLLCD